MDKNFLFDIVHKLKKKGCDEADVFFVKNFSMSSSRRLRQLEKNEQSESIEIGIRGIIGKKQSIISTNNFELKNINNLIDKLYEMITLVPDNEFCGLAEKNIISSFTKEDYRKLDLFDKKVPCLDELLNKAAQLEDSALDNKFITNSEGAEVAWSRSDYFLIASNGMFQEFSKTSSSYILAILAGEKENMEREYDYKSEVYFDELNNLEKVGKETAEKAIAKLDSRKIKTCKTNVIYDSRVSSSLLNNLISASNASLIARGTSYLKDKLGKRLFNSKINIIEDPLIPKKMRSKIIDCEGIKCKKKKIIDSGQLKYFINTLEQSRQLKSKPTGNAARGVSSTPYASPSNLFLENGKISKKEMMKDIKEGLLVTELMGSSINMSNGDYSRGASGFWIENGEISYPVSEVTIAGNLLDIFSTLKPANDLELKFSVNAPSCMVENLTIAGI